MKLSILIVFAIIFSVQGISDEKRAKIDRDMTECARKSGVSIYDIAKIANGEHPENADEKLKEWAFCFVKESGYINEAGVFQTDVIEKNAKADLSEEVVAKLLKDCVVQKSTPQESSLEYFKCVIKTTKKQIKS